MYILFGLLVCSFLALSQSREKPLQVGSRVAPPRKIHHVAPILSPEFANVSGLVILQVLITPEGKVESIQVIRPLAGLTDSAVTAVKGWLYEPVISAGNAAWASMMVTVRCPDVPPAPPPSDVPTPSTLIFTLEGTARTAKVDEVSLKEFRLFSDQEQSKSTPIAEAQAEQLLKLIDFTVSESRVSRPSRALARIVLRVALSPTQLVEKSFL